MALTPTRSGMRMSADERRQSVLAAAVSEFAVGGYRGTSTEDIARRAGISQPYLFRLFGTKRELFLAAARSCFARVWATFERASEGLEGEEALLAMGLAYGGLLADAELLRLQLHTFAASADEEIRAAVAADFAALGRFVQSRTGVDAQALRSFFATGMLYNVIAALDLATQDPLWADVLCPLGEAAPAAGGDARA
ncbi:MAG TPA: helix-turn-helix domain-containing protein [Acidimicrobiales bacterium]|nr:helix-turn-helix domain-containing protein [Acidimicrobiales bacterium]